MRGKKVELIPAANDITRISSAQGKWNLIRAITFNYWLDHKSANLLF